MFNKIQIREILAWTTLVLALILFSATIAFTQTKSINVENKDGKVHIKISKTENGETIKIDTSFVLTDDMDIDKIIEKLGGSDGEHVIIKRFSKPGAGDQDEDNGVKKNKHVIIEMDGSEMSKADKKKLHDDINKSMKDMRRGMEELRRSMKNMHIHIDDDLDIDNDVHIDMPGMEDDDDTNNSGCKSFSYSFSHSNNSELDSLDDENHIIIFGDKGENPPTLEKVITSKNGRQIFIYKKSDSSAGKGKNDDKLKKEDMPDIHHLKYFPNPTTGKFTLMFDTDDKKDISIQVFDGSNKEVFSDKLNEFEGEYIREINLEGKSKGNYLLKISEGKKSLTKKIVLN